MTDKQPEALRLADELDCRGMNRPSWKDQFDAGYELRRLHEENAVLKRCLFQMQEAAKGQGLTAAKAQGENNG